MASAFDPYGKSDDIHNYLRNKYAKTPEYSQMIDDISPEWRDALIYVMARSKRNEYMSAIYRAYQYNVLQYIDPETVKAGTSELVRLVDTLSSQ
jgi:hypothetical protein